MKKTLLLFLMAYAFAFQIAAESVSYTARYDYSQLTIGNDTLAGVPYTTIHYGDFFNNKEPGAPSLPVDYIKFSVPYNAINFSVSTTTSGISTQFIDNQPYPCQEYIIENGSMNSTITQPNNSIYSSMQYYPSISQNAWVVNEGYLESENHVVTVAIMPISYRRISNFNLIRKSQNVVITLSYELSDQLQRYPIVRKDSTLRAKSHQYTESIVVNPQSVTNNAPLMNTVDHLQNNTRTSNDSLYSYLIITTPELKHSLRRLAALKRQKGLHVKIATMNEVLNDENAQCGDVVQINATGFMDTTFTDDPGILRQYLRNAFYNNSTEYALLIGDDVPKRFVDYYNHANHVTSYHIPSDLYFSELDGDWSYGSHQHIESEGEISVGRVLANSESEVSNFTDKLLRFELSPFNGENDFRNRALFTTSSAIDPIHEEEPYINMLYRIVFAKQHSMYECDLGSQLSGAAIIDTISNQHIGFVSFRNLATPYGIITSGNNYYSSSDSINSLWAIDSIQVSPNNIHQASRFNSGLNNLNNKMYPCIGYSVGGSTILFDHQYNNETVEMDFSKSFTTGKDYGGPVFIGYTLDNPIDECFEQEYLFAIKFHDCINSVGDVFRMAKSDRYTASYQQLTYNLMGDPELETYYSFIVDDNHNTQVPNLSIRRTDNSITITSSGYQRISYCNNQGQIKRYGLNPDGETVINNLSPNGSILAYRTNDYDGCGGNTYPCIAPTVLQNTTLSNSQYLLASDFTAGESVDTDRTSGYVTISNGIEYEIEASGTVTLEDGFSVEKGATFAVYPSSF